MLNFKLNRAQLVILVLTLLYTLGFGIYYVSIRNYEFLWYVLTLVLLIWFIGATIKQSRSPDWLLVAFSFWGLLHMLGGGLQVGDGVLYSYVLYPFVHYGELTVLKFDQVVHAYGFGICAILMQLLLERTNTGKVWVPLISVLIAMGLGVVNEIIEFIAVIVVSETGVGGYFNTALDLVFNTIGAIAAVLLLYLYRKFIFRGSKKLVADLRESN